SQRVAEAIKSHEAPDVATGVAFDCQGGSSPRRDSFRAARGTWRERFRTTPRGRDLGRDVMSTRFATEASAPARPRAARARRAGSFAFAAALLSLALTAAAQSELQSILVTPEAPILAEGETLQLSAMGSGGGEGTEDLTDRVTWSSSSPEVATVSASGRVTAVAPGAVTI